MSYTPHTWAVGDVITAERLNALEQAVAETEKVKGTAMFVLTTTGYNSGADNNLGAFYWIKKNGNTYDPVAVLSSTATALSVYGNASNAAWFTSMPIPSLEDYYLAFVPSSIGYISASSGGIATTPVDFDGANAYIITGDFSMTMQSY